MTDELLDLADIASLYRCTRRHARDVIVTSPSGINVCLLMQYQYEVENGI